MPSATVKAEGRELRCEASLVGYGPGPVVQLELFDGDAFSGHALILPPYLTEEAQWLRALSIERLAEAVLNLFVQGRLKVSPEAILEQHEIWVSSGAAAAVGVKGPALVVHPT